MMTREEYIQMEMSFHREMIMDMHAFHGIAIHEFDRSIYDAMSDDEINAKIHMFEESLKRDSDASLKRKCNYNTDTGEIFYETLDKDEVSEWFYESFSDEVIELNENYSTDKENYLKETSEPFVSDMFNQKWKESIFNDEWKKFIAGEIAANFPDKVVDIDIYDVVDYLAYSISTDIFENN